MVLEALGQLFIGKLAETLWRQPTFDKLRKPIEEVLQQHRFQKTVKQAFIEFQKHEVVALHPRGAVTIVALGLDRPELHMRREKRYEILESLYDLAILDIPQSKKARRLLEESAQNGSEYAAMARAALKAGFPA